MPDKKKRTKTTKSNSDERLMLGIDPRTGERISVKPPVRRQSNANAKLKSEIFALKKQLKNEEELNSKYQKEIDNLNNRLYFANKRIDKLLDLQHPLYFQDNNGNPIIPSNLPKPPKPISNEERETGTRPYKGKKISGDPVEYLKKFYSDYIPELNPELDKLPPRFWPLTQKNLFNKNMEPKLKSALQNTGFLEIIPSSKNIFNDQQDTLIKILNINTGPCHYESIDYFRAIIKNIRDRIYLACKEHQE